tara:strand:- start:317 stop:829 length:513 start_codon:yes stop_codon:yes gene_type:complete
MKIYLISINKKMTTIKDYENYLIFEDGKIINTLTGREMKNKIDKYGYKQIGLCNGIKRKFFTIHRLIALSFIPNPDNKPCVDHINRNTQDNRIENLRWATRSENDRNRSCYSNTGKQFIYKQIRKNRSDRYIFNIKRPELKKSYSNKDLQNVIEYRNKFCEENDIEINDS